MTFKKKTNWKKSQMLMCLTRSWHNTLGALKFYFIGNVSYITTRLYKKGGGDEITPGQEETELT